MPDRVRDVLCGYPTYCTGVEALRHCRLDGGSILVTRGQPYLVLSPAEARKVLLGTFPALFSPQCNCSAKTLLLTNCILDSSTATSLDLAGPGMHMVVGDAPSLGLKLQGKFALNEGQWKKWTSITLLGVIPKRQLKSRTRSEYFTTQPTQSSLSRLRFPCISSRLCRTLAVIMASLLKMCIGSKDLPRVWY